MTINDILSKKLRLDVFYKRFLAPNGTTVVEAEKEPLKRAARFMFVGAKRFVSVASKT